MNITFSPKDVTVDFTGQVIGVPGVYVMLEFNIPRTPPDTLVIRKAVLRSLVGYLNYRFPVVQDDAGNAASIVWSVEDIQDFSLGALGEGEAFVFHQFSEEDLKGGTSKWLES